jgi:tRNA A-37 threonylcarbamoyl transferase component Bud32
VGERVGRGATSSVFRARHVKLEKDVALKILGEERSADPELRARFLEEAKSIAKLDHENIVKVLDVVEDQGRLCILMEYVDGDTVQDELDDNGALAAKRAVKIAYDVARALECAHDDDIVHRDIKPANFIVDRKTGLVKVFDFGLAARGATSRVGTPLYMSPEAAQGKRIDDRSDVYALGVSLYQMLTGKHPFTGATVKEILSAQVNQEFVPPSKVKADIGNKYDAVLAKMLVKSKGYRPSATEVVEMLEPFVDEPKKGERKGGRRGGKGGKKRASQAPMLAGAGGLVVVGVLAWFVLSGQNDPNPTPAGGGKNVAVADAGTPGSQTPVAADPNVEAGKAFRSAEEWIAAHPDDSAGAIKEWAAVEKRFPDTTWGKKAAERKALAENALQQKTAREAELAEEKRKRDEFEAERKKTHEDIVKAIAAYDFATASSKATRVNAPEGMNGKEWTKKEQRLEKLGKEFLPRLKQQLESSPRPAQSLDPAAAPDAQIVGADKNGLVTAASGKPGVIAWSAVKPDVFFDKVAKKVFSQSRAEDCLFLGVLAAELGLDKQAKMFRESVDLTDASGEVREKLKMYFVVD